MKTFFVVLTMAVLFLSNSFAAPGAPDRAESKDNVIFEAQSQGIIARGARGIYRGVKEIVDAIAELGILEDGMLQVGINGLRLDNGPTEWGMDIALESRLWGHREQDESNPPTVWYVSSSKDHCEYVDEFDYGNDFGKTYRTKEAAEIASKDMYYFPVCQGPVYDPSPGMMAIPIELRLHAKLEGDGTDVKDVVKDLKVGAFRWIFKDLGLTTQILSYVMKKYEGDIGMQKGLELLSLTFSDAVVTSKRGNFEVVFKARAGVGFGTMSTRNTAILDVAAARGEAMPDRMGGQYAASSSVGVRIAKRVLVEGFAGINYSNTDATGFDDDHHLAHNYDSKELTLINRNWGANVRVEITKDVRVNYTAQWDRYDSEFVLDGDETAGPEFDYVDTVRQRKYGKSHYVNLEVRW